MKIFQVGGVARIKHKERSGVLLPVLTTKLLLPSVEPMNDLASITDKNVKTSKAGDRTRHLAKHATSSPCF